MKLRSMIVSLLILVSAAFPGSAAATIYSFAFTPFQDSTFHVSGTGTAAVAPIFAGWQNATDISFSFSDGSSFNSTNFSLTAVYTPDYEFAGI